MCIIVAYVCTYVTSYTYIHSIYNAKFNEGNKCAGRNFIISKNSLEHHFYAYILFENSSVNYQNCHPFIFAIKIIYVYTLNN